MCRDLELSYTFNAYMESIPDWISVLTNLRMLDLSGNQFSGSLPLWIPSMTQLSYVMVHHSTGVARNVSFDVFESIDSCNTLLPFDSALLLFNNLLNGTLPSTFGSLQSLVQLDLSYNRLSGTIPSTICMCTSMKALLLTDNQPGFSGTIPAEIGNLNGLTSLMLDYNDLNGTIPVTIGNLSAVQVLYLTSNGLVGSIPETFSLLASLMDMDFSWNILTGPIWNVVGNVRLTSLALEFNSLNGSLPSAVGSMTQLL